MNSNICALNYSGNLVKATFKEELKNRFLCIVTVDGRDALCYIPSSCRLSQFIDLTGRIVLLTPMSNTKAKTQYSLYAVEYRNSIVLLNLSKANEIVANQINKPCFDFLGRRSNVICEHLVDGYKSDLYIEDTDTIIEVKSLRSHR